MLNDLCFDAGISRFREEARAKYYEVLLFIKSARHCATEHHDAGQVSGSLSSRASCIISSTYLGINHKTSPRRRATMTTIAALPVASGGDEPVAMEVDQSDALAEAIEKIIITCESRNDSRTSVFEASSAKKETDRSGCVQGGGSLRSQELAQLSRLCAAVASPMASSNGADLDFGAVEGDLLASLFSLLEEHVRSATLVDLVGEACQALEPAKKDGENQEGKNMTIDKVSC